MLKLEELTYQIRGAAMEVHKEIGPGLLESAYQQCLCRELSLRKLKFDTEMPLPIRYKGMLLDCGYRLDIVVEEKIVLELKSVEELTDLHEAQLLSYLRLGGYELGMLMNFNVPVIKDGIKRFVN